MTERTSIEGFDVVLAGGDDRKGGGRGPLLVLFHGFGAPGDDLVGLHRVLDVPRGVRFAFPAAPLDLGPMVPGGRAWWWIDMEARMRRIARGEPPNENDLPDGFDAIATRVSALVTALRLSLGASHLILGGFSQGAMLALEVALRLADSPDAPDALVLLSSTLIARDAQAPRLAKLAPVPVLLTHGREDEILPFAAAERLREHIESGGAQVKWLPFRGGHAIPPVVMSELASLLRSLSSP